MHVCGLNTAVELAAQPAVIHKAVVGAYGHGKAIGHIQARVGRHLTQVGHFAAHKRDMTQANIAQRHDIGAILMGLFFQQALHLPANTVKCLLQRFVTVVRKRIEVAHHLKNCRNSAGAGGMYIVHAKGARA